MGLQGFAHRKLVIEPMYQAFANIDGVKGVELTEQDDQITLTLDLGAVERLDVLVAEIKVAAAGFSQPVKVKLKDNINHMLAKAYDRMHIAVEQGIATGHFVEMAEQIEQLAAEYSIDFTLKVDGDYVYLQLLDGDNFLIQVISRHEESLITRLGS